MVSEAEADWKRLHPLSVGVNLLPRTLRVARSAWPLLLALFIRGDGDYTRIVDLVLLGFFLSTTVGSTIRHWLFLRYRVSDGALEIRSGALYRRTRRIDPRRIQNVELTRNVLHRLTGLVEVRIETASGDDVEGELSALTEAEATDLANALEAARGDVLDPVDEEAPEEVLVHNGLIDLVRYGATANRLVALGAAVGIGYEAFTSSVDPMHVDDEVASLSVPLAAAGLLALVAGVWLSGIATAVLRFFNFQLVRRRGRLVARSGLFTTRQVELPVRKVQMVSAVEPLMRRWAGFGSIVVETAAAQKGAGGTARAEARVPVVEAHRLAELVRIALPTADADPWADKLHPPHPMALRRSLFRAVVRAAVIGAGISWLLWPWGLAALLLVPVFLVIAWLDHRHQGWLVTDRVVVARRGYWNRRSVVVPRDKLQSVRLSAGPLLRRLGLGRLGLKVAGSSVVLPLIGWDEARSVLDQLVVTPPAPDPEE